jgi:hypothetical protein
MVLGLLMLLAYQVPATDAARVERPVQEQREPTALRCMKLENMPSRLRVLHRAELRECAVQSSRPARGAVAG